MDSTMSDVAIVDYGINNVRSVRNAVEYCGFNPVVTHEAGAIADASHVILPGVGAFGDAMANIRARGIEEMLDRHVREKGKPFLAVCLGTVAAYAFSRFRVPLADDLLYRPRPLLVGIEHDAQDLGVRGVVLLGQRTVRLCLHGS